MEEAGLASEGGAGAMFVQCLVQAGASPCLVGMSCV